MGRGVSHLATALRTLDPSGHAKYSICMKHQKHCTERQRHRGSTKGSSGKISLKDSGYDKAVYINSQPPVDKGIISYMQVMMHLLIIN